MARPRKDYGSEQVRIEALRQANRDRVKRYRDAKKAEVDRRIAMALDTSDCELPTVQPDPQEAERQWKERKANDWGDPDVEGPSR